MKPGDVVVLKARIVEGTGGGVIAKWSASSTNDYLTLIEGKADIGGCVLAKDYKGEIHCINPDLFELVWTQEEAVARKMMEPPIMQFNPVSHDEVMARFHQSIAKAMAINLDDAIMNGILPTADEKGTRQIARQLGMGDRG